MPRDTLLIAAALAVFVQFLVLPAAAQEPSSEPVQILSDGAALQARFYRAECDAMCPTLLLIPGFPGSERPDVLGLGERLSADGLHVLVVNPRGLHQSEGMMSFFHTLDDIGAAFDWLHDDAVIQRFGVDTTAVVLGGHSFGGGTTMAYAARDPRVRAIVSVGGTDHGVLIRKYQRDAAFRERVRRLVQSALAPEGPARADFDATWRDLSENQDIFGLQENAARLADRSILLIGGWEDRNVTMDEYMLPLYRSLREVGAEDVTFQVYHDNHGFGQVRERLANDVRSWVRQITGTNRENVAHAAQQEGQAEVNKATARRWFEDVINRRALDALADIYALDYVHHGPEGREIRGHEELRAFAASILAASDDRRAIVDQQIAEGDLVVTRFTSSGHHTGPWQGLSPTGEVWTTEGIVISRIEDGKIAEDWEVIHISGM